MFDIIPLGVGSAMPTRSRHLAGTFLRRDGRMVLFDCGEGTQLQMVHAGLTRGALDAICITHLHGDHLYGLPGLLTTLALLQRTEPLTLVGPVGLGRLLDSLPGIQPDQLPFPIHRVELDDTLNHAVVFEDEASIIEARPLEHRVFCAGFRYQEKERPGSLDIHAAEAAGLTDGAQFAALKRGEHAIRSDGTRVGPDGIVGPPRPGASFAYVLDTMPCEGGRLLAHNVDLLMHEATFTDEHADRSERTGHSTARQAAEVARDAAARRLLLTHFSARYQSPAALVAEARAVFPETNAAEELRRYEVRPASEGK